MIRYYFMQMVYFALERWLGVYGLPHEVKPGTIWKRNCEFSDTRVVCVNGVYNDQVCYYIVKRNRRGGRIGCKVFLLKLDVFLHLYAPVYARRPKEKSR